METAFDILTGIGLSLAAGIRPFLPALAAGALASANLTIDFGGTDLAFLEQTGWLLAIVIAVAAVIFAQRALGPERVERGPVGAVVRAVATGIGMLLFAGALADHSETWWPGLIGGAVCAVIAILATSDLVARTRARLDPEAASALTLYAEGAALLLAVVAILVPPVSVIALGLLLWLLLSGRRRQDQKYAGLRILR